MKQVTWIPAAALMAGALTLAACGPSASTARNGAATSTTTTTTSTSSPALPATHSPDGTVTGTFMRVGGPLGPGGSQPRSVPLTGTVFFAASHHQTIAVRVGKTGRFAVGLPPGSYIISGRSPSLGEMLASGVIIDPPCTAPGTVTVAAGRTVHLSVVCAVP